MTTDDRARADAVERPRQRVVPLDVSSDRDTHALPRAELRAVLGARQGRGGESAAPIAYFERVGDELVEWAVVELDARDVPGARAPRCLVFWREQCLRRVWDYPADWSTLDDVALTALSMRR